MGKIKFIVDGGKASTTPVMAQTLGPMGINLQQVVANINEKTRSFQGIKVPVEINVNEKDKSYEIKVGSPPTTELIKKELKLEKGSGSPDKIKSSNISIEHVIKIAKMKMDGMFDNTLKTAVKTVAGTCNSLGILIENKTSQEFNKDLEAGMYDREIKEEKTEPSAEKITRLKQDLVVIQEKLTKELQKKQLALEKEKEAAPAAPQPATTTATTPEAKPKEEKAEEAKPKEEKKDPKKK